MGPSLNSWVCHLWTDTPRWRAGGADLHKWKIETRSFILKVKETFWTRKVVGCQKGNDKNLPISLLPVIPSWAGCAHVWIVEVRSTMDSEPGKVMTGERKPRINASCKWGRPPWSWDSSAPTHVSIHSNSFSSNKHLTCFTTFHLWESFSAKTQGPWSVTDHWSSS